MDLNQLEYFLRVVGLGSINRAAKELGLSQPALSRSLSQLEHDLGQQLLVRCRTGITITEAGSILVSRGRALLREAGAIREELANDPAGRVVVGMPAALRHLVTLPALRAMRSTSPATAVRVHEGFNVFLRDMLNHGLLDIAVIAMEQVSETSIAPGMLVREPLVLVRSVDLPRPHDPVRDRKSTRLNSSHVKISYAVFCLKKKKKTKTPSITKKQKNNQKKHNKQ